MTHSIVQISPGGCSKDISANMMACKAAAAAFATPSCKKKEEDEFLLLQLASSIMEEAAEEEGMEEEEEEEEIIIASSSRKRDLDKCLMEEEEAAPETASTPITNHFDGVLECLDFLRSVENDNHVQKQDVIEAIRGRLHNMISKILLGNTITSMSMLGWRLE